MSDDTDESVKVQVFGGPAQPFLPRNKMLSDISTSREGALSADQILQPQHHQLLSEMLQSHAVGRNCCLMGSKGSGKSFTARLFARALGYVPVETLFLFQDMTARDLLQVFAL
jgi:MoxR-like ATPase